MQVEFHQHLEEWDAFVATSPQRSAFVGAPFLRALGTNYELVVCSENGRILGGAPLMLDAEGRALSGPHPFTMYQGVLLAGSDAPHHSRYVHELRVVEALAAAVAARHPRFCWMQSWRFEDYRALQWLHYHEPEKPRFRFDSAHTGVLDLDEVRSGFDAYVDRIRTLRKREYMKARSKVEIVDLDREDLLDELHEKTFARQGVTRNEELSHLLRRMARSAVRDGFGVMKVALVGGNPASANLFLYDDRTAFYLIGANDPEYRNTGASTALMLHMIRDAAERGLKEVDFVGVNSPARGDYKTSFNAVVRAYQTTYFGNAPT